VVVRVGALRIPPDYARLRSIWAQEGEELEKKGVYRWRRAALLNGVGAVVAAIFGWWIVAAVGGAVVVACVVTIATVWPPSRERRP
jgi:protein-S-isoprenylcysteine O-methyltransferase Ste14